MKTAKSPHNPKDPFPKTRGKKPNTPPRTPRTSPKTPLGQRGACTNSKVVPRQPDGFPLCLKACWGRNLPRHPPLARKQGAQPRSILPTQWREQGRAVGDICCCILCKACRGRNLPRPPPPPRPAHCKLACWCAGRHFLGRGLLTRPLLPPDTDGY